MIDAFLGLDFGTESVRALIADRRGRTVGTGVSAYRHGQIVPGSAAQRQLFPGGLAPDVALQHPADWLESAGTAIRAALSNFDATSVRAIGVSFTSCTMLPALADGTPLCDAVDPHDPHAWPKLWKHHGAVMQTERLNHLAHSRGEAWIARYGGIVGVEWLFPKILEVIECAPEVGERAEVWLEAGDWLAWQLTGAPYSGGTRGAHELVRSTCQAGYKALWSATDGYPSREFFQALHPKLVEVIDAKLPGTFVAPGRSAGTLAPAIAKRLGLPTGIPVSAAVIDAHAGVPGAGVGEAGALVMVMGTSGCHMMLGEEERAVAGVAGIVRDGILAGFVGYETGQAAMGDSFDWVRRLSGEASFDRLNADAAHIEPGAEGAVCIDWLNGCRTPLMDGSLRGGFVGLGMHHGPSHIYRAALEASAMGLRWIVDTLREGGVPVRRFVATGGLPRRNPLFARIATSVLEEPVEIHGAEHGSALGAAIIASLAAGAEGGGFNDTREAIESMAGQASEQPRSTFVEPDPAWCEAYRRVYARYRALAASWSEPDSPARTPDG